MAQGQANKGAQEVTAQKCLVDGCESIGTRRGLCSSCRNAAKREIEAGRTTELELIGRGLLLAKGRKGRLAAALENRRKESDTNVDSDSERKSAAADTRTGS